jgi:hypothetical protein
MVDFKELTEGTSVAGAYTLGGRIRHDNQGTLFAASGGNGDQALLKLLPEQAPNAERQFGAWQRSRLLHHTNLLELREVGRGEIDGDGYIFAALDPPDEFLSAALESGPMSESDARSILEAAVAALRYLHGKGMVHGALDADHIVAVGDTVKLTTDTLTDSTDPDLQAEDVWQLGELVRNLRAPEPLQEPLATIVSHATAEDEASRWNLDQIAHALMPVSGRPAAPLPPPRLPERRIESEPEESRPFPKWIFAALAVLLLAILVPRLLRKPDPWESTRPVPSATQSTPAARPAPVATSPAPVLPEPTRPAAVPSPVTPKTEAGAWRVVAFTYRSHGPAAQKVEQINKRWPNLDASVFAPKDLRGYYLVALGGRMSHTDATRLQRKARSMGLPRDTYVQNFSE